MLNKEQIINLTEILAVGSVTAAGFLIGGTIGASVMAGIGLNLASNIVLGGASKLKEHWISDKNGILNHDIQRALLRAYLKSLIRLEKQYFKKYDELQENEKESKGAIHAFFDELAKSAEECFLSSLEKAVKENEVKEYLFNSQETGLNLLWNRIGATKLLFAYNQHFVNYLHDNLLYDIQFCFAEELKTDNRECNKAWRAFQRLLLEGIKDDIKSIKTGQENITADLQKLEIIETEIIKIKNIVAKRTVNEPFQKNLEEIQSALLNIASIANRTEKKIDALSDEVKKLTEPKNKTKIEPYIPEKIKTLLKEASELWSTGEHKKSKDIYSKTLELANNCKNELAIAKSKSGIAAILVEWEKKPEEGIKLLKESLLTFRSENLQNEIIRTLSFLGTIATDSGNLDRASAYLSEAKEIASKDELTTEAANVYFRLGWLEDHKGFMDKALEYYNKSQDIYFSLLERTSDNETRKDVMWGIAGCYQHKGLVYRRKGEVHNVTSNFNSAIEWFRKNNLKPEMAKIFYLLAELHFREAEYELGNKNLKESKKIYRELEYKDWYARCLELGARVKFTLGDEKGACDELKRALKIVQENNYIPLQIKYLINLGYLHLHSKETDKANKYYIQAKDLSYTHEFLEDFASSVKSLAQIAEIGKKNEERDRLLKEGIAALEKYLLSIQSKPKQGFIIGEIGFFYELLSQYEQALMNYQKTKKIFEDIEDVVGKVNSLGSIARMKGKLNKRNEEYDIYRELKKLLDGTPYYDLIAGTDINLGEIQLDLGNTNEAKILFEEALYLCKKYNLHYLAHLKESMKRLSEKENLRKPPELDLHQLIDELFELINWFPEAKDSIFRLWMWGRRDELLSNYRNTVSAKFMVCQDDLQTFNRLVEILEPYGDLFLQVVSKEYPGSGLDFIPYPMDKPIFFECDFPTVKAWS